MTTERNPTFDLYRSNWLFGLHLTRLMQENHQRLRQFQVQTAEQAIAATGKLSDAVANAQDGTSLSALSTTAIRQQTEFAVGFWQDFFTLASANRIALLNGVRVAVEQMQARNTEAFQAGHGPVAPTKMFQEMLKPFEPFMHVVATHSKPATRHTGARRGTNHAE